MNKQIQLYKPLWIGLLALCLGLMTVATGYSQSSVNSPDSPEDNPEVIFLPMVNNNNRSATPPPDPTPSPPSPTPKPPGDPQTYYLSPSGTDNNSGKSEQTPWATFEHAWNYIKPGDTLILLDGTYYQSISPVVDGQLGSPITIQAMNDGKAIIDGQFQRIPVSLVKDDYYVIEGIVARNGTNPGGNGNLIWLAASDHNVLRRISGYNADIDKNSAVFTISNNSDYNLIEDCVAAGSGRKMMLIFGGSYNTIRRCHADWQEWDGRLWGACWPWGEGFDIYGASNNILENSISYSRSARAGVSLMSQSVQQAIGNKILGTMSVLAGMKEDGVTPMIWSDTRPQPTEFRCMAQLFEWPVLMSGFGIYSSASTIRDNLWQDIFSWSNARYGLSFAAVGDYNIGNNQVNRATIFNNGLNNLNEGSWGGIGAGAKDSELANFTSIENSTIENIYNGSTFTSQSGEGARLTHRYIDGVLTDEPLWPWPMEERIKAELGYSVTCIMGTIINDAFAQGKAAEGIDMTSRDPDWASNPNNLVVQACNSQ
jgi:hypothetical protein